MIVEIAEPARKSELRVGRPIDAPENDDVVLMPVRANFVDLRIGEILCYVDAANFGTEGVSQLHGFHDYPTSARSLS